jgi:hypothetical protein
MKAECTCHRDGTCRCEVFGDETGCLKCGDKTEHCACGCTC